MDVQIYRQYERIQPSMLGIPTPDDTRDSGLKFTAVLPTRGSAEAAGYDVRAFIPNERFIDIMPLSTTMIPTGLFFAEEALSVILVCSRSGLASKGVMVANGPGIIDSDYRGEVKILLSYIAHPNAGPFRINHGDRVAQLLFLSPGKVNMDVTFTDVEAPYALRDTNRGSNGFGSTGV